MYCMKLDLYTSESVLRLLVIVYLQRNARLLLRLLDVWVCLQEQFHLVESSVIT